MIKTTMGVIHSLKTKVRAHAAAVAHRWPAKNMQLILVSGTDGGQLTIVTLGAILRKEGAKVGIVTSQFVEIAGERVEGSDQADVLGDPFRMQSLFAQMRRAGCQFVIVDMPSQGVGHGFAGLQPTMVIMRRCGDSHVTEAFNTSRKATWRQALDLRPKFVVVNRDDPCFELVSGSAEITAMTFGTHEKAESQITKVSVHPKGSAMTVLVDHQTELKLVTEITGKTAIYSLVAAAAAAYLLHIPIGVIEDGIAGVKRQAGSLHYIGVDRPYQIALDYAVTPDGIAETLETLKHFAKNRLIVVVSSTLFMQPEWRPMVGEIVAEFADRIVVTDGEYVAEESAQFVRQQLLQGVATAGADARTDEVPDRERGLEKALSIARRDDTIVVLASVQRPYRQLGSERQPWNDGKKLEEQLQ